MDTVYLINFFIKNITDIIGIGFVVFICSILFLSFFIPYKEQLYHLKYLRKQKGHKTVIINRDYDYYYKCNDCKKIFRIDSYFFSSKNHIPISWKESNTCMEYQIKDILE
jgi:hypothetical protein